MLSYNVISATQAVLKGRADWMEQGQSVLLAARITPTTVDPVTGLAAVRCPDCYDPSTRQVTEPDDPTCLGVGFVIPVHGATAQQGGYLNAVTLADAFINDQEDRTQWTAQGMASYTQDTAYVSPTTSPLKKGDLLIRTGPTLPHSRRYVVADEDQPKTLGASILFYTYVLEYRRSDNVVYRANPADLSGLAPSTWS